MTGPSGGRGAAGSAARRLALALVTVLLGASTAATFQATAGGRRSERERDALAGALLRRGITRVHTDYWTCDRLAFQTRERIVCAVVGDDLRPGHDRYPPYRPAVEADPGAAWALPLGSPQAAALQRLLGQACPGRRPRAETLHGYLVVWPARLVRTAGCAAPLVPGANRQPRVTAARRLTSRRSACRPGRRGRGTGPCTAPCAAPGR
ncbi:MAG TPA: hypothetical protein VF486_05170 [Actinomycetes bacterium]